MTQSAREQFEIAKAHADEEYLNWLDKRDDTDAEWTSIGYGTIEGKFDLTGVAALVKANWGKIAIVGAAFGIPVGIAEPGAFGKVLGVLSNFWIF